MKYEIKKLEEADILPTLYKVNGRLNESHKNTVKLVNDLSGHSSELGKVKKKYDEHWAFSTPSRSELFTLIQSDQKSNSLSTRTISNLFININENIDDLSKMTGSLALLSCMSYKDLLKASQEIKKNKTIVDRSNDQTRKQQHSMDRLVKSHIDRAQKDKNRDALLSENRKNLKLIKHLIDATPDDHFIKVIEKQNKRHKVIFLMLTINLLLVVGLFLYVFTSQS